jgi:hypothetical protein
MSRQPKKGALQKKQMHRPYELGHHQIEAKSK